MNTRKSLKVSIMGKSYLITADEDSDIIEEAAALVDTLMQQKTDRVPLNNEGKVAVIVALQIATELTQVRRQLDAWTQERNQLTALLHKEL